MRVLIRRPHPVFARWRCTRCGSKIVFVGERATRKYEALLAEIEAEQAEEDAAAQEDYDNMPPDVTGMGAPIR